ncbi:hypothetical protein PLESTF_000948200 [Pleodorina starrii]|nr:hypothetical protein PLESTF_000948200 [Pleodorina starrii]
MGESLIAPLVPKEGFEGPSAPPAPGHPSVGVSSLSGAGTSDTATGYPVIGPAASAYPPILVSGSGSAAQQHYRALSSGAQPPPVLVAAQPVLLSREHHHHHCHHHQPDQIMCGSCHRLVVAQAVKEAGLCSYIGALGLCALGCWPCACLPFCLDAAKDTVYRCPVCRAELHRRRAPLE